MPQLGAAEIMMIVIVALLLFGPDRIPEMARNIGKAMREVQKWRVDLRKEFDTIIAIDETPDMPAPASPQEVTLSTAAEDPVVAPLTPPDPTAALEPPRSADPYA